MPPLVFCQSLPQCAATPPSRCAAQGRPLPVPPNSPRPIRGSGAHWWAWPSRRPPARPRHREAGQLGSGIAMPASWWRAQPSRCLPAMQRICSGLRLYYFYMAICNPYVHTVYIYMEIPYGLCMAICVWIESLPYGNSISIRLWIECLSEEVETPGYKE